MVLIAYWILVSLTLQRKHRYNFTTHNLYLAVLLIGWKKISIKARHRQSFWDSDSMCCVFVQQENRKRHASTRSVVDMELDDTDDGDDNAPLFYQPGKRGFYSPRPGKNSEARLNCFRNIGR